MATLIQLASALTSWETVFSNKINNQEKKGTKFKREKLKMAF